MLLVYLQTLFTYCCPFLSHRPPHPETDSVGAVPLLYIISVQYRAKFRRQSLFERLGLETQPKNTPKIPGLVSSTQVETASGVCPTNLRISAGSSRMKSTELPYFIVTSRKCISRSQKIFFAFIFTFNCHDYVMITLPQHTSS